MEGKDEKSIFIHAHAPNRETLPLSYKFSKVLLFAKINSKFVLKLMSNVT